MKLVLTNDDGYGEPGLTALIRVADQIGSVVVVAPKTAQSGVGHQVTMKTPLRVENGALPNHFIVDGTPVDCTRLALKEIAPDADWVLAGINRGANLGSDVYQSGTVAAVREAAILGKKGVAASQYVAPDWTVDWQAAAHHFLNSLRKVMSESQAPGQYWNINLPSPITVDAQLAYHFCPLDKNPHKYRFRKDGDFYAYDGIIHDRPRTPDGDVDVCFGGSISITRMEI